MEEEIGEEAAQVPKVRGRHIKKRALKNKALAVSFDEKDLKDYVSGFHKRKKKRRKEAEKQQEEALRRKRLEQRKKRKLEREYVMYGGALPPTDSAPDETEEYGEEDEETEAASVTGTTLYDNGDMKVTVTTSEISREEENFLNEQAPAIIPSSIAAADKKHNIPMSKSKPFKKVAKQKSHPKSRSKRDKKKGKKKNQKRR